MKIATTGGLNKTKKIIMELNLRHKCHIISSAKNSERGIENSQGGLTLIQKKYITNFEPSDDNEFDKFYKK